MRRKALFLAALPAASAVSLANFQPLKGGMMPPICEAPYYAQIPACTASDFHNGCSEQCEKALEALAEGVISACSHAPALPNSLLGAILQGGIVEAICPPPKPTEAPPPMSIPEIATMPTRSPSVQVYITPTSTSTPQAQPTTPSMAPPPPPPAPTTSCETSDMPEPTATLEGVTRVSMCGAPTAPPSLPAPVVTSPASSVSPQAPQETESSSSAAAAAAAATTTAGAGNAGEAGSGNPGAPFQLVGGNVAAQGAASTLSGSSVLALVIAALACILL